MHELCIFEEFTVASRPSPKPFPPLIVEPSEPSARPPAPAATGWPLLRLGFRPFYLGAAGFAAVAVPLWAWLWLGGAPAPTPAVPPLYWHAHEMLYGFAVAVICGFLLTAGKAWTGEPTPRGAALGGLAGLWLAARVAAWSGPPWLFAVLDALLLPLVATALARVLLRAGNRRNLPLVGILALLALANLAFHASVLGALPWPPLHALHAALAAVVMMETVIAGRIVPAFTMSATPGLRLQVNGKLEAATLATTAAALLAWVALPASPALAVLPAAAALLHAARLRQWRPGVTRTRPLLWILHAGYAWIPLGLALLAAAQLGWVGASAAVHALGVGATGGLIIGMVTRTARGHTGRPLALGRAEVAAYALVLAAAAVRVFLPLAWPAQLRLAVWASAGLWSAAFALYLAVYLPWLTQARVDGKDG